MSDDMSSAKEPGKTGSPFPSRRELHGSRIPTRTPQTADGGEDVFPPSMRTPSDTPQSGPSPYPAVAKVSTETGAFPTRKELRDTGMLPQVSARSKKADKSAKSRKAHRTGPAPAGVQGQPAAGAAPARVPQSVPQGRPQVGVAPGVTQGVPQGGPQVAPQSGLPGAPQGGSPLPMGQNGVRRPAQVRAKKAPKWRVALVLVVLLALVGGAVYIALTSLGRGGNSIIAESLDFPGPGEGTVEVTITSGELGSEIGQTLVDAGVVKTLKGFTNAFDANSAAATIKPGTYTLRLGMTSAGALAALLDDANRKDNAITVNAGQTLSQVKEKMVAVGGFTDQELEDALSNPEAIGLPEQAGGDIEGWLSPGSYDVGKDTTATDVFAKMVGNTVQTLNVLEVPQEDWQETLTKASILEREAGSLEDMPKVARVIQNRLDSPAGETLGLLQMDSTVLYGVGKSGGLPTEADLASDSPYNTYRVAGLPPGPIASPSEEAIEATVHPAEGDWLYFVTVNLDTGETLFTSSLAEQEANIELLRQWCEANKDRC